MVLLMPRQHSFIILDFPTPTTPNMAHELQISPRTEYQTARLFFLHTFKARIESKLRRRTSGCSVGLNLNNPQTLHFVHYHSFCVVRYLEVSLFTELYGSPCVWCEGLCGSKVWLHQLISALRKTRGSASRPGRFIPEERVSPSPDTHWTGGGVGPRTGLDVLGKK